MGALDRVWRWRRGWMTGIVGVLILVVVAGCDGSPTRTVTVVTAAPTAIPTATPTATLGHTTATWYTYYQNALTTPASGWGTDQNCFFGGGGFHIKPNLACQSPVRGRGDVVVWADMQQISGAPTDENGIEIRRSGNPASLYEFDIAATGAWLFKVCIGGFDHCNILTSGSNQSFNSSSPGIHIGVGAVNTVNVFAIGSHFDLFVNGGRVGQADDATLAYGDVWLDTDGTSECVFRNFEVKGW